VRLTDLPPQNLGMPVASRRKTTLPRVSVSEYSFAPLYTGIKINSNSPNSNSGYGSWLFDENTLAVLANTDGGDGSSVIYTGYYLNIFDVRNGVISRTKRHAVPSSSLSLAESSATVGQSNLGVSQRSIAHKAEQIVLGGNRHGSSGSYVGPRFRITKAGAISRVQSNLGVTDTTQGRYSGLNNSIPWGTSGRHLMVEYDAYTGGASAGLQGKIYDTNLNAVTHVVNLGATSADYTTAQPTTLLPINAYTALFFGTKDSDSYRMVKLLNGAETVVGVVSTNQVYTSSPGAIHWVNRPRDNLYFVADVNGLYGLEVVFDAQGQNPTFINWTVSGTNNYPCWERFGDTIVGHSANGYQGIVYRINEAARRFDAVGSWASGGTPPFILGDGHLVCTNPGTRTGLMVRAESSVRVWLQAVRLIDRAPWIEITPFADAQQVMNLNDHGDLLNQDRWGRWGQVADNGNSFVIYGRDALYAFPLPRI
jgi:hypothetical protein